MNQKYIANEKTKLDKLCLPLKQLRNRNEDVNHINYKIYYLLCNPFIYVNAYAKISKNPGALTKGIKSDDEIMTFFGKSNAENIAQKFKNNNYSWKPTRRTWIPKPGKNKLRPIDTPTQEDRIVQEAIRGILENIFEPEFREFENQNKYLCTNYGFRPNKSTWDAANSLKIFGQATTYAIEGDISGAYNNVDHEVLINLLSKRIKDKKFIDVISKLLKSGIMEKERLTHNIKGTPQGGIVSPLLFNIYMFELDKFIYSNIILLLENQNTNKTKKRNPEYTKIGYQIKTLKRSKSSNVKDSSLKRNQIKNLINIRNKIPSYLINSLPKKSIYSRYADDWVLLITSTNKEAIHCKDLISKFISNNLKMELDNEKTLITKLTNGISFLGYNLNMYTPKQNKITHTLIKKDNRLSRILRRTTSRKITICPDKKRLLKNLTIKKFCDNNYFPIGKRSWCIYDPYEIVLKYKQIMLGITNYYSRCDNVYILYRISYILQYSCAKTIANRQKITMPQVFKKYGKELRIKKQFYLKNQTLTKEIYFTTFTELRKQPNFGIIKHQNDEFDPFHIREYWRTKMKIYQNCCICNSTNQVAMHHINSLRKIKRNVTATNTLEVASIAYRFRYVLNVIKK
jgi:group II intron reverse transcriptase/maturase